MTPSLLTHLTFSNALSRVMLLASACALSLLAQAVNSAPAQAQTQIARPDVVRIYSSLPVTGTYVQQAQEIRNSINLAMRQHTNKQLICDGTMLIKHRSFAQNTLNDQDKFISLESKNVQIAVEDPSAMIYIGPFDSDTLKATTAPALQKTGIAMLNMSHDDPALTQPLPNANTSIDAFYPSAEANYLRVVPPSNAQAMVAARWMKSFGVRRVYLLHKDKSAEQELYALQAFSNTAKTLGIQVRGVADLSSVTSFVQKLQQEEIQAVYYLGTDDQALADFVRALREAKATTLVMVNQEIYKGQALQKLDPALSQGVLATVNDVPLERRSTAYNKFYTDYSTFYDAVPTPLAAYAYEATTLAIQTLDTVCATDRNAVLKQLKATKDYKGIFGTWSFNAQGDTTATPMMGYRMVKGTWTPLTMLNFK